MLSEVRYARSGDVNIAYRVVGEGPFDVVFVPGTTSRVDFVMDVPAFGQTIYSRIPLGVLGGFESRRSR